MSAANDTECHEHDYRPQRRGDEIAASRCGDETQLWKYVAADHCAEDADHDVGKQSEAVAVDDLACEPAGESTDDDPHEERLRCERHGNVSPDRPSVEG